MQHREIMILANQWSDGQRDAVYSTAQLQGNVCTRSRRIPHFAKKRCGSYVSLAAALLCGFLLHRRVSYVFQIHLLYVPGVSRTHSRCILHAFQTCANITLELSCTIFSCWEE